MELLSPFYFLEINLVYIYIYIYINKGQKGRHKEHKPTIPGQEEVTTWMDENIYKGKIKFEMKCNTKQLEFLDTKVTLRPGKENGDEESRVYLVPAMYSKPTDRATEEILQSFLNNLQVESEMQQV